MAKTVVWQIRTLKEITLLLANVFYKEDDSLLQPIASTLYGFRILTNIIVTIWINSLPGNAVCLVASGSTGREQDQLAQEQRDLTLNDPWGPEPTVWGLGTVHVIQPRDYLAKALNVPPSSTVAMLANMAVHPDRQGQGIGTGILRQCEKLAHETFKPEPKALILLVYKDNSRAVALYESMGFRLCPEWVDPMWLEDAEKGRLGNSKRLLFFKELTYSQ